MDFCFLGSLGESEGRGPRSRSSNRRDAKNAENENDGEPLHIGQILLFATPDAASSGPLNNLKGRELLAQDRLAFGLEPVFEDGGIDATEIDVVFQIALE